MTQRIMKTAIMSVFAIAVLLTNGRVFSQERDWLSVNDFAYQLQHANAKRIAASKFDLVVTSIAMSGSSPETIKTLKANSDDNKLILAYMSIGQAETYREYWQNEWRHDPPDWLAEKDESWPDDYWVKYWKKDWQDIIYGSPDSYLDRIIALGFDGVYLDRVDAYEYFEEKGRDSAAREMVDFIMDFSRYARAKSPGFGIFPQNAEELGIEFSDYLNVVTGTGVEGLYYGNPRDHEPSPKSWTREREEMLDQWVAVGKLVLVIDYTLREEQIADSYARARAHGYIPYVTDRSLRRLRVNKGFEPD